MSTIYNLLSGLKPVLVMVVVEATLAGVNIFYKLASNDGMNLSIMVAYRYLFSAAFIVPVALVVERKKRPKLTWTLLFQAFLCGLFGGSLSQNLYVNGIKLTSATFASATTNLIPAVTFILAISFGMEKLGLKTEAGKTKVLGTMLGVGGAMLMTFYNGPQIQIWKTNVDLFQNHHGQQGSTNVSGGHRVLGSFLSIGTCFCYSAWLIVQAKAIKKYPCPYSLTALTSIMASVQGAVLGLCMERDWSQWKLGWNIRLLTVAYTGVLASGVIYTLMAWCVQKRGPLFVSAFNPLVLVIVAIVGSLILNETLHLGSVLGSCLIIFGLYTVLWGKSKEVKKAARLLPESASGDNHGSMYSGFGGNININGGDGNGESQPMEMEMEIASYHHPR